MQPLKRPYIRHYVISHFCQVYKCEISCISTLVLSHLRGGSRSSRTRGGMRWTRGSALTNGAVARTAKSCGPDTPTLVSSWRKRYPRNDGGKQARFTGESTK